MTAPDMDLWTFALAVYRQDGVADACLSLQDDHGCDVPLLLFCLWVGQVRGRRMSDREIAEADGFVGAWRERVVGPLRAIRRDWKFGVDGLGEASLGGLRERVKALEIAAEKTQIEALDGWWRGRPARIGDDRAGRLNMEEYLAYLRHADGARTADLLTSLCDAARRAGFQASSGDGGARCRT